MYKFALNKCLCSVLLCLVTIVLQQCDLNTAASINYSEFPDYNLFASDLFSVIVDGKTSENIVYSPTSIQTSLALAFMGAEGETAEEMRHVLRLGKGDKIQIAQQFCNFIENSLKTVNTTGDFPKLQMANRLYVNDQLKVSPEFNKIALQYFDSEAEEVDFSDHKTVVEKVNHWVEQQTENKIKNVLKEDSVNADTNAVLVNAIYFKAEWLNPFSLSSTSTSQFYLNSRESKEVEMMFNEHFFAYGELPELDATALEMPYENSDISMLIILPNKIEGLENLELKLKNKDLSYITDSLEIRKVHAYVPKFRIEFDIDLKEPLEKVSISKSAKIA